MDVLRAVAAAGDGCSPASIADTTGVPRPTVYRLLETLESLGLVERNDGEWTIGYELVRLGRSADLSRALALRAHPVLEELVATTGETAMLAVPRRGAYVDVISQVDAPNLLGVMPWVGRPVPTHASVAGKLLIADLSDADRAHFCASFGFPSLTAHTITDPAAFDAELRTVAKQGFAETVDELEQGLSGIGAPIRQAPGGLVGVVGIYGPTARIVGSGREAMREAVMAAGEQLSERL